MKNQIFKTNINCSGCVAKVKDQLNSLVGENNWQVDILNPKKPLTILNENIDQERVIEVVENLGFKIEPLDNQ
ncbi:MAG TPA: heavy-metal-associated domain-containing protein [Bacteroidia bacterium]